jgi:predicted AAA+ superfamily ATPase
MGSMGQVLSDREGASDMRQFIKQEFHTHEDWESLVEPLRDYYLHSGVGIFGRLRAFHWKRTPKGGVILPIPEPDPIRFADLIGYDDQKQLLLQNTAFFLSGYPANNVFIYGDRGTGKSSAIKALLHQFPDRPLRMLEISAMISSTFRKSCTPCSGYRFSWSSLTTCLLKKGDPI